MNRRSLLRFIGMAPVAAPLAAQHVASAVVQPSAIGVAASALKNAADPWDAWNASPAAQIAQRAHLRATAARYLRRKRDLDFDIDALKSVPIATKVRMQMQRDLENERALSKVDKVLAALQKQFGLNHFGGTGPREYGSLLDYFDEEEK